jgi:hypothetical protein
VLDGEQFVLLGFAQIEAPEVAQAYTAGTALPALTMALEARMRVAACGSIGALAGVRAMAAVWWRRLRLGGETGGAAGGKQRGGQDFAGRFHDVHPCVVGMPHCRARPCKALSALVKTGKEPPGAGAVCAPFC